MPTFPPRRRASGRHVVRLILATLLLLGTGAAVAHAAATSDAAEARRQVEKKRVPYRKTVQSDTCSTICIVEVARLKKKQRLEIREVSCGSWGNSAYTANYYMLTTGNGTVANNQLLFAPGARTVEATTALYVMNEQPVFFAEANEFVRLLGSWNNDFDTMLCTIAGELVTFK